MIVDRNNKPSAVKASISVDMLIKCAFAYFTGLIEYLLLYYYKLYMYTQ